MDDEHNVHKYVHPTFLGEIRASNNQNMIKVDIALFGDVKSGWNTRFSFDIPCLSGQ